MNKLFKSLCLMRTFVTDVGVVSLAQCIVSTDDCFFPSSPASFEQNEEFKLLISLQHMNFSMCFMRAPPVLTCAIHRPKCRAISARRAPFDPMNDADN
jgi:hypothetical protein